MVLSVDDFRSHVARRPTRILVVIDLHVSGYPKIRYPEVPLIIKDQVFWLDIPMYDPIRVQILQGHNNATGEELHNLLPKELVFADVEPEIPSWHQIHHQIQIIPVLEREDHIDEKWVLELAEEMAFFHN